MDCVVVPNLEGNCAVWGPDSLVTGLVARILCGPLVPCNKQTNEPTTEVNNNNNNNKAVTEVYQSWRFINTEYSADEEGSTRLNNWAFLVLTYTYAKAPTSATTPNLRRTVCGVGSHTSGAFW